MEKVFENFAAVIMKINKLIQRIKQYEMRDYGLKAIHVMCVYHLNNHDGGLTSSELVRLTLEDKAAISRALNVLQEKGYIVYDKSKYNTPVKLTDTGKELAEIILDRSSKAVEAGSANMPEEQRVMFYKFLGETADKLSDYYALLCTNDKN